MTTEKIISVLETTRLMFEMSLDDCDCDEDSAEAREDNEETIEAINEAIKALKRKTSTDAVSREAVLDEFDKWVNSREKYYEHPVEFARSFMSLPLVTPERPKGKWIDEVNDFGEITAFHCSNCYEDTGHITECKYDFCPSCGADMRGGE